MTRPRHPVDPLRDSLAGDFAVLDRETTPVGAHPDEEMWVRLACDELSADERERLVSHALTCDGCAAVSRAVGHVRERAGAIDAGAPRTSAAPKRRVAVWLALAAALVIVIAGAVLLRRSQPADPGTDQIVSTNPSGQTAQPARSEPRIWARLGDAPEVRLPASLALAVRGTDRARDDALEAFGAGIAPYREGRYREAADRLEPLSARRPDIPEFAFYLGVARLFAGDPVAAIAPLRQARTSTIVADDARWYEAVALERAGRREEADALLKELCATANPYQRRACAAIGGRS